MSAVQIKIDQLGKPSGVPGRAREDLDLGVAVTLSAIGGPFLNQEWSFGWKAVDVVSATRSSAAFSSPNSGATLVSPIDIEGTYIVKVSVDSGDGIGANPGDNASITFYAGAALNTDPSAMPRRPIAAGETTEHNVPDAIDPGGNVDGWARERARWDAALRRLSSESIAFGTRTTVSVEEFGDDVGGGGNDSAAFAAAIAALPAGGQLILISGKTYNLDSGLRITKELHLYCAGRCTLTNTVAPPVHSGWSAIVLIDDGALGQAQFPFTAHGVDFFYAVTWSGGVVGSEAPDVQALLMFSDGRNHFSNCTFRGAPRAGAYLRGGTLGEFTLVDCEGFDNGYAAGLSTGKAFRVVGGNYYSNSVGARTWNALDGYCLSGHNELVVFIGVRAWGSRTEQFDTHSPTTTVIVIGCWTQNDGTESGFSNAVAINDVATSVLVTDNVFNGAGVGHVVQGCISVAGDITAFPSIENVTVTKNTIRNYAANQLIDVTAGDCRRILIDGNSLVDCPTTQIGIFVEPMTGGTIGHGPRQVPRFVQVTNNLLLNAGSYRIDAAQELTLGGNTWAWDDSAHTPPPSPFALAATGPRGYLGKVRFTGRPDRIIGPVAVPYSIDSATGGIFNGLVPAHLSWSVGDKVPNMAPRPGTAGEFVCVWAGAADIVASTTGTTTAGSSLITRIASVANILAGDVIEIAGEQFGASSAVEVLRVDGATMAVDTTNGSVSVVPHSGWQAVLAALAVNDWIAIAGVTFGGAAFTQIATITLGVGFTTSAAAQQTVNAATLSRNRVYVSAPATNGVTAGVLSFPRASFREVGVAATPSNGGDLGSADKTRLDGVYAGRVQRRVVRLHAGTVGDQPSDFTQATNGVAQVFNIGDRFPANARILGREERTTVAAAGGTPVSITMQIGVTGTPGAIATGIDLMAIANVAGTDGSSPWGAYGGQQPIVTISPDGVHNLAALTAGDFETEVTLVDLAPSVRIPTERSGCTLWFPADDSTAMSLDAGNATLVSFVERSSLAATLTTSGTGSTHPRVFQSANSNGRPSVMFDGFDDVVLGTSGAAIMGAASEMTWIFVLTVRKARIGGSDASKLEPVFCDVFTNNYGLMIKNTPEVRFFGVSGAAQASVGVSIVVGTPVIITCRHTATNLYIGKNLLGESAPVACGQFDGFAASLPTYGLAAGAAGTHGCFDLHEHIAYNRSVRPSELVELVAEVNAKWGVI